ncbi:21413_t:CDS:2, partial [Gigaspora margarita]
MSAIVTKIIEKYNLSPKMSVSNLSKYISEFLENLTDDKKRNQGRQCLRDGFKFSSDQLNIWDIRAKAYALALSAKNANADNQKKAKANRIDYPDHFMLESVRERLDGYDVSTLPNLQTLTDVIVMLCIRPAKLTTLCITNAGVTEYVKNWDQPDIPRKFISMKKNQEQAKELLTWIQEAISSGRIGDPGAIYGVVAHEAKNMAHAYTIT